MPDTSRFSGLLLSDLHLFFSFILSHPLYFSYFIFFSPYLLKLLSFLSPLVITTSLLLLAFLTLYPLELPDPKLGFIRAVTERLTANTGREEEEDFYNFEELELYKVVFDLSLFNEVPEPKPEQNFFQALEAPGTTSSSYEKQSLSLSEAFFSELQEKTVEIAWEETTTQPLMEKKRSDLEKFLKELDGFEGINSNVEEKKVDTASSKPDKAEETKEVSSGSEVKTEKIKADKENPPKVETNSQRFEANSYDSDRFWDSPVSWATEPGLGSYGSMRKEKEWRRTLACKLFEERQNVDGGEGMDLLWETYEMDSNSKLKPRSSGNKNKKNKKKSEFDYFEEDDDDYEEEDDMDAQLCCLQALKFSAGKMNLGMGRPNLVKISKAIKGWGGCTM
ncbi:hypothetical protein NMG60_11034494 [Bertholletia excelsa]